MRVCVHVCVHVCVGTGSWSWCVLEGPAFLQGSCSSASHLPSSTVVPRSSSALAWDPLIYYTFVINVEGGAGTMCHGMHMCVRVPWEGVSYFLLSSGSWGSNSSCRAWWQMPLLPELAPQSRSVVQECGFWNKDASRRPCLVYCSVFFPWPCQVLAPCPGWQGLEKASFFASLCSFPCASWLNMASWEL